MEHTKDQKNIYPIKTIHEKSRRIIYRQFHFITRENGRFK
jgi:hypothetical protein